MIRRSFLASILAAGAAPAYVKAGILMPVKKIIVPTGGYLLPAGFWSTSSEIRIQDPSATVQQYFDEAHRLGIHDIERIVARLRERAATHVGDYYQIDA